MAFALTGGKGKGGEGSERVGTQSGGPFGIGMGGAEVELGFGGVGWVCHIQFEN